MKTSRQTFLAVSATSELANPMTKSASEADLAIERHPLRSPPTFPHLPRTPISRDRRRRLQPNKSSAVSTRPPTRSMGAQAAATPPRPATERSPTMTPKSDTFTTTPAHSRCNSTAQRPNAESRKQCSAGGSAGRAIARTRLGENRLRYSTARASARRFEKFSSAREYCALWTQAAH